MANFYFFTDKELILPQNEEDAFGRVKSGHVDFSGSSLERWRVSSMHKASADPMAYAICSGEIIIQDDVTSGDELVNLILKPNVQPSGDGVDLPEVKYYVYRGIKKSSLIFNNPPNLPKVVFPAKNTLSYRINDDNDITGLPGAPVYLYGIDRKAPNLLFNDTDKLDNLFYVPSTLTNDPTGVFQKFPVFGGDSLGTFDMNSFGIEIVLNRTQFKAPLSDFRGHRHHIETAALGTSSGSHWEMVHQMEKERILNYLDIAAFYGAFQDVSNLYIRSDFGATTPEFDHAFTPIPSTDIYTFLLEGEFGGGLLNALFYNRNIFHLDIQNELGYSFNQMKNYGNDIKIKVDSDFIGSIDDNRNYYNDGSGSLWPLMQITSVNTLNFPEPSKSRSTVRISMPAGDNTRVGTATDPFNAIFYVEIGTAEKHRREKAKVGNSNFYAPERNANSWGYYDEFAVSIPVVEFGGAEYPVAHYSRIRYLKRISIDKKALLSEKFVLRPQCYLDHLFPVFDLINPFKTLGNVSVYVYDNLYYVDLQPYFSDQSDFMGKIGIARDTNNTTLFIIASERRKKNNSEIGNGLTSITSDILSFTGEFLNYVDDQEAGSEVVRKNLLVTGDNAQITKFKKSSITTSYQKDLEKVFLSLIIPNTLFDNLETVAANKGFDMSLPVYLCIGEEADGEFIANLNDYAELDDNGDEFLKIPIHLRGYMNDGGTLKLIQTTSDGSTSDPKIILYGHKF